MTSFVTFLSKYIANWILLTLDSDFQANDYSKSFNSMLLLPLRFECFKGDASNVVYYHHDCYYRLCSSLWLFVQFYMTRANLSGKSWSLGFVCVELQIRGGIETNSKIIFLISQLWPLVRTVTVKNVYNDNLREPLIIVVIDKWYLRWPKWLTFHFHTTSQFRISNSEFRIPKFALQISEFGIRNCEVYVVWASGNS